MGETERVEWQGLSLREAYQFGLQQGLGKEISAIRDMEIEWDRPYTSSLRRGFIVELFKQKGMLEAFADACWPNGKTLDGERRIRRYLKIREQYEDFLSSGQPPEFAEDQEVASEQEFAAESDLRDFLAEHLSVIELGLSLYQDEKGKGVEYPIAGGRIDILAREQDGRLVVIELKVSRGRNSTIGQILYYMGWVDTNLSGSGNSRGIIVAKEISDDLSLACRRVSDVSLYKYDLSVTTARVYPSAG